MLNVLVHWCVSIVHSGHKPKPTLWSQPFAIHYYITLLKVQVNLFHVNEGLFSFRAKKSITETSNWCSLIVQIYKTTSTLMPSLADSFMILTQAKQCVRFRETCAQNPAIFPFPLLPLLFYMLSLLQISCNNLCLITTLYFFQIYLLFQ